MNLLQGLETFIEREKQLFIEDVKSFVQEHKDAYERYIQSAAFEQDIDDWTKSFSSKYFTDQTFSTITDRSDRIRLKLQQLTRKIRAATAEGGIRGAKMTIPSMNLKVILGGAATGAMGQLLFALRYGGTVLLKKFVLAQARKKIRIF